MSAYRFHLYTAAICLALASPLSAQGEDNTAASPPPGHSSDKIDPDPQRVATESSNEGSEDVNLKKELVPENIDKNVSIHAYVRKEDKAEISEYSMNGRVYMIKVKPPGTAPAYYLYDDNGDGTFNKRLPGNYKHLNPPGWVLKTF